MPKQPSTRNPSESHRRKVVAARRVGVNARCACGEARPEALISGSNPRVCAACRRTANGQPTIDEHHFAGRANNPITIPTPINDHRALLSVAQAEWPKATLANPEGSPLIAAAACVRGFVDTVLYLMERGLLWISDMLEKLDEFLMKKLGPQWWFKTGIEQFAPKEETDGQ
jgi:hypothetical protein